MDRAQTVEILCNQIRMRSLVGRGSFILVEGNDDSKLLRRFLSEKAVPVPCRNREIVIEATRILTDIPSLIGIIDSDAESFIIERAFPANIFQTDFRDMEISLFAPGNLESILIEIGSSEKIEKWCSIYGSIFERLMVESSKVGGLLHLSNKQNLGLNFQDLKWKNFANKDTLEVNLETLVEYVKSKSHRGELSTSALVNQVNQVLALMDRKQIIRGHDIISWIAFALQSTLGSVGSIDTDSVATVFRLSVSRDQFQQLALYRAIQDWSSSRPFEYFPINQ